MKTITYSFKNKIDYEVYEVLCVSVEIADDESMSEKFNELRADIDRLRRANIDDLNRSIYDKEKRLRDLEWRINQATTKWNMIQDFLSAQGIKNADMMPAFDNLLPPAVVAEEDDDDAEDDPRPF